MTELRALAPDGVPISALDDGGDGPTVLVVHPGGRGPSSWDEVARLLTDHFRVVRIRRRIYEPGVRIGRTHSMAVEAADVLAVAGLLREDGPVLLVGHSSGAVAALETALADPAPFAGVFVYDPPIPTRSFLVGEAGPRARAALDAGDPTDAIRIHSRAITGLPDDAIEQMLTDPRVQTLIATHAEAQIVEDEIIDALGLGVDRYRALPLPVTLVQGELSFPHLHERVADLAAVLPDSRVVTLAGQGHGANSAAPEALAAAIRETAKGAFGF
ncbi:alpha/beta fold hydrolase [Streptomyces violens]|uniref:alpha/beta fold hydrolase n=1 Tax=Streptomyces violens TaxID=66377 RepID=UPI00069259B9|nr:alpha/beta hydrolase [Streptomyces violens]